MYYNFKDRTTDMDSEALKYLAIFCSKYDSVSSYHLNSGSKYTVIGKDSFFCRFCGRSKGDVTFKQKAHAFPHIAGNRWLFSHHECDICNAHFGKMLENEFGNFMLLNHIIKGVKGKGGSSKYVLEKEGLSIVNKDNRIEWQGIANENIKYDQDAGIISVDQKMPGYIPVAVYKTLVKIALTIMPGNELIHFKDTIEWINERSHDSTRFPFVRLWMLYRIIESNTVWDQTSLVLSKRKLIDGRAPYMLFYFSYANIDFQLPLPLCTLDNNTSFDYSEITYLPHLHDLDKGVKDLKMNAISMHGRQTVRGQKMTFTIKDLDGTGTVEQIKAT